MKQEAQISLLQLEKVNRIIVELYDEAQPYHTRIINFFQTVMELVYFDKSSLLFFYKDPDGTYRKRSSITLNWNSAALDEYDTTFYKYDDTIKPVDVLHPVMMRSSNFFDQSVREKTLFWQKYQRPSNAAYEIFGNILLNGQEQLKAKICFARGVESGDFTVEDLRILRLFQPHLSNVSSRHLSEKLHQSEPQESYNCIGSCTLNASGQVLHSSTVFNVLNQRTGGKLQDQVRWLCEDYRKNRDKPGMLSREYKMDDEPLFLELLDLGVSAEAAGDGVPQFSCTVYDLSHFFTCTLAQARERYAFSNREFDVLSLLVQGYSYEDIAKKMFLSIATIKKSTASIYEKMDITSMKQIFSKLCLF